MQKKIITQKLFYLSLCVAGYFVLLWINAYAIKFNLALIGFFQELLTIPLLIVLLFLFILSVKYCIDDKFRIKKYSFWTFFTLLITILLSFGSLFLVIFKNLKK